MSTAQLAAVSYMARYAGHTHHLYAYQLRRWFAWCDTNGLDPLVGIERAHVELHIGQLGGAPASRLRGLSVALEATDDRQRDRGQGPDLRRR